MNVKSGNEKRHVLLMHILYLENQLKFKFFCFEQWKRAHQIPASMEHVLIHLLVLNAHVFHSTWD